MGAFAVGSLVTDISLKEVASFLAGGGVPFRVLPQGIFFHFRYSFLTSFLAREINSP